MDSIAAILAAQSVLPVVTFADPARAAPLARALAAGGVTAIEVTLRTAAGLPAIRSIAREAPEVTVGAGTVLSPADLEEARAAGARFAVSPGATPALYEAALASGLPFLPAVATPSELMVAMSAGYQTVKLFPADQLGGPAFVRALAGPFPTARFCPTGGVDAGSAPAYLALPNVLCVGGSWLAPPELVAAGDFSAVTLRALGASALRPPR